MTTDKAMVTEDRVSLVAKAMADSIGHGMSEKCMEHAKAVIAALAQAEQPVAVKPLDLSNLLKHAFMSGLGSATTRTQWVDYDPSVCPAYGRILSVLSPSKIEAGENTAETLPPPVTHVRGMHHLISDTIGFGFEPKELQTVNADDLIRLAEALTSKPSEALRLVVEYDDLLQTFTWPVESITPEENAAIDAAYDKMVDAARAALATTEGSDNGN